MPFLYLDSTLLGVLHGLVDGQPTPPQLVEQLKVKLVQQRDPSRHKVVREITFEGSEAELREQVARSLPEGVCIRGRVQFTVRTISNSLPQVTD